MSYLKFHVFVYKHNDCDFTDQMMAVEHTHIFWPVHSTVLCFGTSEPQSPVKLMSLLTVCCSGDTGGGGGVEFHCQVIQVDSTGSIHTQISSDHRHVCVRRLWRSAPRGQ